MNRATRLASSGWTSVVASIDGSPRTKPARKRAAKTIARSAAAAVRPLYAAEAVERRLMLVTFAGTANADIITVDISGANIVINNLSTGTNSTTSDAVETQIIINGLGGADTISILRNGLNATTINAGAGDDTITVGNGAFDANINANVTINGGSEIDTLNLADTGDSVGNDAVTMTATTFKKTVPAETVTWAISAAELVENVNINLGAQPETVSILGTATTVTTNLNAGGGNDTVTVGNDFDSDINGSLTIAGGAGTDSLVFDDTGDTTGDTYLFDAVGANGTLTKTSASGAILSYSGNEAVLLNAPAGVFAHTFNVLNALGATTINAGDGNDTINFGNGVIDLEQLNVGVTFNGQAGTDIINFNDQNNAVGDTYTLTATTLGVAGTGTLTYSGSEGVTFNAGTTANTINVNSTSTAQITINAGAGNDTILVSGGTDTVAAGGGDFDTFFSALVSVNGGAGTDSLTVNDLADGAGADDYGITAVVFQKGTPQLWYTDLGPELVEQLRFTGSNQPSSYQLYSTNSAQTSFIVEAGTAADTVLVQNAVQTLGGINGPLQLLDRGGVDTLTLGDASNALASTYNFNVGNVVTGTSFSGSIDIGTAYETATLIVNTAAALAQTFNVNTLASYDLTIAAGLGNDTLNFGGGDWSGHLSNASVNFDGGGGIDLVFADDSVDAFDGAGTAETYTLTSVNLAKAESVGNLLNFTTVENIVATLTPFADVFNVTSMLSTHNVTVDGGNGNDTVDAATSNDVDNTIVGNFQFNGDAGSDRLDLDDTGDSADNGENYVVTSTSFIKTSAAPFGTLTHSTVENIEVIGNGGTNMLTAQLLADGQDVTLNGGLGNDTLNTGANDLNDQFGDSYVAFQGGGGTDVLNLSDIAESAAPLYSLTADSLAVGATGTNGSALLGIDTVETFTLGLNNAATTINITGLDGEVVNFTLNAGAGNDTINVNVDLDDASDGGLLNRTSLNFNGEIGIDAFNVTDLDNEAGDDVYRTGATTVTKDIAGSDVVLNDATMESLTLTGSTTLASTYQLDQLPLPTTINGGALADTFVGSQPDFFPGALATINGGNGNDTLLAGTNGAMGGLFVGGIGNDRIDYDDTTGTLVAGNTITLNNATLDRPGNPLLSYDTTLEDFQYLGSALGHVYNIVSNLSARVTINAGDGNDTINAGGGDIDLNFSSHVTLIGGNGIDPLNFLDGSDDAGGDTVILRVGLLGKGGQAVIFNTIESINYTGSPQSTAYTLESSDVPVTINAGLGNDTINLGNAVITVGTGAGDILSTVSVNGGLGADTINLGNGDVDEFNGFAVTIAGGGGGTDFCFVNDVLDVGPDSYDFSGTHFTKTGGDFVGATISAANFNLMANESPNIITYDSGVTGELNGNGGADTFDIATSVILTIHGGGALDTVKVNQDGVGAAAIKFDQNEDLASLEIYSGGMATVVTSGSGNTLIDMGTLAFDRGTFNVNNNWAIIRTPNIPFVVDKLTRGYNAGAWNGVPSALNGVITSSFANTSAANDGVGYIEIGGGSGQLNQAVYRSVSVVAGNLLVSHLLNGDTNFDRTVDFADLVILAQNYNLNGRSWGEGNFDYDALGNVGFGDLVSLAQNYNLSLLLAPPAIKAALPRSLKTAIKSARNTDILASLKNDVLFTRKVVDGDVLA